MYTDNDLGDRAVAVNKESLPVTGALVSSDGLYKKRKCKPLKRSEDLDVRAVEKVKLIKRRQ